jgi:hypothetical protein
MSKIIELAKHVIKKENCTSADKEIIMFTLNDISFAWAISFNEYKNVFRMRIHLELIDITDKEDISIITELMENAVAEYQKICRQKAIERENAQKQAQEKAIDEALAKLKNKSDATKSRIETEPTTILMPL